MEIRLNGKPQRVEEGLTVLGLLETIRRGGERVAVAVNEEVVPRAQHARRRLAEGDRVEVIRAVAGG